MKTTEKIYITAAELSEMLGVSIGYAYKIIRQLNQELAKEGFLTISGKIPSKFIEKKWYGAAN